MPKTKTTIATYGLLSLAGILSFTMPGSPGIAQSWAVPPDVLNLGGVLRDFTSGHPDFGTFIPPPQRGHFAGNIAPMIGFDRRPMFTGSGRKVLNQWYDGSANPINRYAGPIKWPRNTGGCRAVTSM
ncbi:MAG: hypothetical protein IID28_03575 [Planctomycetes bacterium]|nr:hypothetical protein [Planctomycetota bacterium]